MEKTLIFGHQKPDTDSVTSAIVLSYLKNKLGENTEPRVLGNINNETAFVLKYFNVKTPKYLNDVRTQIKNVDYVKNCFLNENDSIYKGYKYMKDTKISTIPVISNDEKYIGSVSMKDVASNLISGNIGLLHTSYDNILEALKANEILRFDEEINGNIFATTYRSSTFREQITIDEEISSEILKIIENRKSIILKDQTLKLIEEKEENANYIISPIIVQGDIIGTIVVFSQDSLTEETLNTIKIISNILAKYIEQ